MLIFLYFPDMTTMVAALHFQPKSPRKTRMLDAIPHHIIQSMQLIDQFKAHDELVHLMPNLHCKNALVGRYWRYLDLSARLSKITKNPWNANAARSIPIKMEQIRHPMTAIILPVHFLPDLQNLNSFWFRQWN